MKGKQPSWSVEIMALRVSNSIALGLTRWVQKRRNLGGAKGSSTRGETGGLKVFLTPFGTLLTRPMIEGTERERCLQMSRFVRPGLVANTSLSMALQKVEFSEYPVVA